MIFNREQTFALLEVIESRKHITLHLDMVGTEAQGILLGGDLENDILCVSETYPDTEELLSTLYAKEPAHIRIKIGERFLTLSAKLLEHEQGLTYWKIVSSRWTTNKRWQARARFQAYQSPKVHLTREFAENIAAELHDISERGFSVSLWNKDLSKELLKQGLTTPLIVFNEHFTLRTEAKVIDATFHRQPCCHTRARFQFVGLTDVQLSQVALLIESMNRSLKVA